MSSMSCRRRGGTAFSIAFKPLAVTGGVPPTPGRAVTFEIDPRDGDPTEWKGEICYWVLDDYPAFWGRVEGELRGPPTALIYKVQAVDEVITVIVSVFGDADPVQ